MHLKLFSGEIRNHIFFSRVNQKPTMSNFSAYLTKPELSIKLGRSRSVVFEFLSLLNYAKEIFFKEVFFSSYSDSFICYPVFSPNNDF